MPKPNKLWFWVLAVTSVVIIIFLLYLAYTSDFTNVLVVPIIATITTLLLLIIWYLPKFYVQSLPIEMGKNFDREKERLKLEDDTRKTFAQIIGGIVFLGGLIFTYNTFRLQQNTYQLQQEGQLTDRFTKAVAQLGDDKLEIRLGGMYALERIAKDSPKDHWTVMEILSAYIRENAKKKEEETSENKNSKKTANDKVDKPEGNTKVTTDIQAALTIIARRKIEQDSKTDKIDLSGANLSKSNLSGAFLAGADLIRADLSRANLSGANLSGTDLSGANLSGASLSKSNLSGAFLAGANLSGAHLGGADLSGVFLGGANLSGAFLVGADLSKSILPVVDLSDTKLSFADLSGADLSGANLSGADLSVELENFTFEQLSNAIINENTALPSDLESRKADLLEISKKNLERREKFLNESNKK